MTTIGSISSIAGPIVTIVCTVAKLTIATQHLHLHLQASSTQSFAALPKTDNYRPRPIKRTDSWHVCI